MTLQAREILLIGAGGHGRVCADIATAAGYTIKGFYDANKQIGDDIFGPKVIANDLNELLDLFPPKSLDIAISIGENSTRERYFNRLKELNYDIVSLFHPSAIISDSASIEIGTVIMPRVVVQPNVTVNKYCILNTACIVGRDSVLAKGVHICPGVVLEHSVDCGENTLICTRATVLSRVQIHANAIVGAGSLVQEDVPEARTVVGVPSNR